MIILKISSSVSESIKLPSSFLSSLLNSKAIHSSKNAFSMTAETVALLY